MKRLIPLLLLALLLSAPQLAQASLLIEYQGTTYLQMINQNEILAKVTVGASDVAISGFGVYGQAQLDSLLKFVIFGSTNNSAPLFISSAQAVAGSAGSYADQAQWYDITLATDFTLLAGQSYAIGVFSNTVGSTGFRWGTSPDTPFGPYPTITENGLSLPYTQSLANSGIVGTNYVNNPYLYTINNSNRRHTSVHLFARDPEPDPVATPEPGTLALTGLGLVGLAVYFRRRAS